MFISHKLKEYAVMISPDKHIYMSEICLLVKGLYSISQFQTKFVKRGS